MNIFIFLPFLMLLIISFTVFLTGLKIIQIYRKIGEPIFIHGGLIFIFLFLTFLTGAIGVLLELDQLLHPIFNFNVFAVSMTYIGYGYIFKSLKQGISVLLDYGILLLAIAPMYGLALILGLAFEPIPALLSQLIPFIILLYMDNSLIKRIKSVSFNNENEEKLVKLLENTFSASRIIHFLGLLASLGFSILFITGFEYQAETIWGDTWQFFDYLYFLALILMFIVFLKIYQYLKNIAQSIVEIDTSQIINALLN